MPCDYRRCNLNMHALARASGLAPREVFSPGDIPGLIGWWDAAATGTVSLSGQHVTRVENRVPSNLFLRPAGTTGPEYRMNQGVHPAFHWSHSQHGYGFLVSTPGGRTNLSVKHLFMVMSYRNNAVHWADLTSLFVSSDSIFRRSLTGHRVLGHINQNRFFTASYVDQVHKNGVAVGDAVLPLNRDVLHFSTAGIKTGSTATELLVCGIGSRNFGVHSRSWHGDIHEILAFSMQANLSPQDIAAIEGYLQNKWA